ncbi:MAG: hypothetical protein H0X24_07180 [Ktedonobacterales bacterium]|nr:hypothetical protein [Ktedonobacterales bacterium]
MQQQQWEYLEVVLDRVHGEKRPRYLNQAEQSGWEHGPTAIAYFNTLGQQGWELILASGEQGEEFLFKRPVQRVAARERSRDGSIAQAS